MAENDITICVGPAGSGKTAVAVGLACEYLLENKVDKIVITRPVVESGKGLGYLPGSFAEKIHPYLVPVLEEMGRYFNQEQIKTMRSEGIIEVCPLEYMRGRNFHRSFIILDEAQNATFEQIKMFITRTGRESKSVINGDLYQSDLPYKMRGALERCIDSLDGVEGIGISELTGEDIIRNKLISTVLACLDEDYEYD
jgi:phosphate starvation-inducible PhoH-like protein|tara:strand:- start:75431 stop:76021 length:591 start_codon:yes stop_codon:yes gene_type:complete